MEQNVALERLILEPAEHFKRPSDVLLLDAGDALKIRILQAWEDELIQLENADYENMEGKSEELLQEVHNCLIALRSVS